MIIYVVICIIALSTIRLRPASTVGAAFMADLRARFDGLLVEWFEWRGT